MVVVVVVVVMVVVVVVMVVVVVVVAVRQHSDQLLSRTVLLGVQSDEQSCITQAKSVKGKELQEHEV